MYELLIIVATIALSALIAGTVITFQGEELEYRDGTIPFSLFNRLGGIFAVCGAIIVLVATMLTQVVIFEDGDIAMFILILAALIFAIASAKHWRNDAEFKARLRKAKKALS